MGFSLSARRAIQEFLNSDFPKFREELNKAAGCEIDVSINWENMVYPDDTFYPDLFKDVFFVPMVESVKQICFDDMGRDALKAGLKTVVFSNLGGHSSPSYFTFESGVLTLDHDPRCNVGDIRDRTEMIVKLLDRGL